MIYRSSQIKTAKQCIAKSYYKYNLGLSPKRDKSSVNTDLFFGKAVHKAIEIYFKENYDKAVAYLESLIWPARTAKTKNIAKMLVNMFRLNFKDTLIFSEQYFKIDVDKDMTLLGRYDIVSKDITTNISDIKTSSPNYLLAKPDDQFISYYIAGRKEFPDMDKVVIYNLDPNQVELHKKLITYSNSEIDEWLLETKAFLSYYKNCVEKNVYPKTPGACLDFNRLCEYHELCTASPKIRQILIENAFVVSEETKNLRW